MTYSRVAQELPSINDFCFILVFHHLDTFGVAREKWVKNLYASSGFCKLSPYQNIVCLIWNYKSENLNCIMRIRKVRFNLNHDATKRWLLLKSNSRTHRALQNCWLTTMTSGTAWFTSYHWFKMDGSEVKQAKRLIMSISQQCCKILAVLRSINNSHFLGAYHILIS